MFFSPFQAWVIVQLYCLQLLKILTSLQGSERLIKCLFFVVFTWIGHITWPHKHRKFLFECWKIFHMWALWKSEILFNTSRGLYNYVNFHINNSGGSRPSDKRFFSALQASVWSKNKKRGLGSPRPSPRSALNNKKLFNYWAFPYWPSLEEGNMAIC